MSEAEQRRERIQKRIAASQGRLERDSTDLPAIARRDPLPDAYPPEDFRALAKEHPLLTVAAGVGLGLLAGALIPKGAASKTGRRLIGLATVAAELGLAFSKQAADKAGEAGRESLTRLDQGTAPLRQRAGQAGTAARSRGVELAGEAIKLAAKLRK